MLCPSAHVIISEDRVWSLEVHGRNTGRVCEHVVGEPGHRDGKNDRVTGTGTGAVI